MGPWWVWNVNRKSYAADRYVSVPTTLSDLERRDAMVKFFRRILQTLVPFDLERTNLAGMYVGEGCVSWGSSMPRLPQGVGPKRSPVLGFHFYLWLCTWHSGSVCNR